MSLYKMFQLSAFMVEVMAITTMTTYAQDYVVIVNPSVIENNISEDELIDVYSGELDRWKDNLNIKPCYLKAGTEGSEALFDKCIKMSFLKFKKVWLKKVFAGYGTEPSLLKSLPEIITFVSSNPGAIGVVPPGTETEGCKCLIVKH